MTSLQVILGDQRDQMDLEDQQYPEGEKCKSISTDKEQN